MYSYYPEMMFYLISKNQVGSAFESVKKGKVNRVFELLYSSMDS